MTQDQKKLVEALKELKTIRKRIESNIKDVGQFSSILSSERSTFGSEDKQREHVKALLQATEDLAKYASILKMRIDLTNMSTVVEINGKKYSISQLIQIRQERMGNYGAYMIQAYNALSTAPAEMRKRYQGEKTADGSPIVAIPLFNEQDRIKGLTRWTELRDLIDGKLEVVNAQTDLLPLPDDFIKQIQ